MTPRRLAPAACRGPSARASSLASWSLTRGVAFLMYRQFGDIDKRCRESAEDSLVGTAQRWRRWSRAHRPAASCATTRSSRCLDLDLSLYARRFSADIYGVEKTRVELRMTVVDRRGTVVFDSSAAAAVTSPGSASAAAAAAPSQVGADHSRRHDVYLALRGRYGARTTPDIEGDARSSVMYVAARRPRHDRGRCPRAYLRPRRNATAVPASPISPKARCSQVLLAGPAGKRPRRAPVSASSSSMRSPTCIAVGRRSRTSRQAARWRRCRCPRSDRA